MKGNLHGDGVVFTEKQKIISSSDMLQILYTNSWKLGFRFLLPDEFVINIFVIEWKIQ